ncbi:MAG: alpha/beta hydrolase [Rhodobacteraceae bacterium]|jgi:pimeloyl-ACP methyl ester carboxylesterase|nr:alpha/beta hydrolase [Paracoccaceae bacterium]
MSATTLHSESSGAGAPALLFVHGFCCDSRDWEPITARLAHRYRCASIDLPNHGRSVGGDPTMAAAAHAVNEAKRRLRADHVVLIGHSLATKIIREAYCQDAEGVAGLILIDGSLYVSDRDTMLANARAAVAGGMAPFLTALFGRMFDEGTPRELKEFLIGRALERDLDLARALFLDSVDWDTRSARQTIASLRVPAMVIQATTFDSQFRWRPLQPGESTGLIDAMRGHLADFEAVVIPGSGHFVMADQPDLAAAAIDRFAAHALAVAQARHR